MQITKDTHKVEDEDEEIKFKRKKKQHETYISQVNVMAKWSFEVSFELRQSASENGYWAAAFDLKINVSTRFTLFSAIEIFILYGLFPPFCVSLHHRFLRCFQKRKCCVFVIFQPLGSLFGVTIPFNEFVEPSSSWIRSRMPIVVV